MPSRRPPSPIPPPPDGPARAAGAAAKSPSRIAGTGAHTAAKTPSRRTENATRGKTAPPSRARTVAAAAAPVQPLHDDARSLGDRTAQRMRDQILDGAYAPGQRLSETVLAESLGISRNTLREVFRTLTQDGLLTHQPNRGVFVAVPSLASIIDVYRVRRMIECRSIAQAVSRHPAGLEMRAAVEAGTVALGTGDWRAVGTANMAFHRAIVGLADSERLNRLFGQLLVELRLAFGVLSNAEYLHAPYVPLNRRILDLYEADRMLEAAEALDAYLVQSERVVLAAYARGVPPASGAG